VYTVARSQTLRVRLRQECDFEQEQERYLYPYNNSDENRTVSGLREQNGAACAPQHISPLLL